MAEIVEPSADGQTCTLQQRLERAHDVMGDGQEKRKGWQSEQTKAGELVSVLLGPCAEVKRVAFDPLPLPLGRAMAPLVSVNRDTFLQNLSEDCRGMTEELAPS
jgi:hypothetical protein